MISVELSAKFERSTMSGVPTQPSSLALWLFDNGSAKSLTVRYVPTGDDTAETKVDLVAFNDEKITVDPRQIGLGRYDKCGVFLNIDHASVVQLTPEGRAQCEAWKVWQKKEASDISEFQRLKEKFKGLNP